MTDYTTDSSGGSYAVDPSTGSGGSYAVDASTGSGSSSYQATRAAVPQGDLSIGEILSDASKNLSLLVSQEIELGKAELRQSATRAGKGVGLLAGAGVAGLLLLVFISVSAAWGIGQHIGVQWGALIVAIVWAIVAAALALAGRAALQRVRGLPQTADTVGKIPNALKGQEEANR